MNAFEKSISTCRVQAAKHSTLSKLYGNTDIRSVSLSNFNIIHNVYCLSVGKRDVACKREIRRTCCASKRFHSFIYLALLSLLLHSHSLLVSLYSWYQSICFSQKSRPKTKTYFATALNSCPLRLQSISLHQSGESVIIARNGALLDGYLITKLVIVAMVIGYVYQLCFRALYLLIIYFGQEAEISALNENKVIKAQYEAPCFNLSLSFLVVGRMRKRSSAFKNQFP